MKTADISDDTFLTALETARAVRQSQVDFPWPSANRWDIATVLAGHPEMVGTDDAVQDWPDFPWKIVLAKARRLIKRGLIHGCACGCRGDFEVIR